MPAADQTRELPPVERITEHRKRHGTKRRPPAPRVDLAGLDALHPVERLTEYRRRVAAALASPGRSTPAPSAVGRSPATV